MLVSETEDDISFLPDFDDFIELEFVCCSTLLSVEEDDNSEIEVTDEADVATVAAVVDNGLVVGNEVLSEDVELVGKVIAESASDGRFVPSGLILQLKFARD